MSDLLVILVQWVVASLVLCVAMGHVFAAGSSEPKHPTTGRSGHRAIRKMAPPEERMSAVVRPTMPPRSPERGRQSAPRPR